MNRERLPTFIDLEKVGDVWQMPVEPSRTSEICMVVGMVVGVLGRNVFAVGFFGAIFAAALDPDDLWPCTQLILAGYACARVGAALAREPRLLR